MITLTLTESIKTQIGGAGTVSYERVVLSPITFDPVARTIRGGVRLISTSTPAAEVVTGSFEINLGPGVLMFRMDQKGVSRRVELSGAQITAAQDILNDAQNALESGMISLGVIPGVQSAGV